MVSPRSNIHKFTHQYVNNVFGFTVKIKFVLPYHGFKVFTLNSKDLHDLKYLW